jgi:hypothetical protein
MADGSVATRCSGALSESSRGVPVERGREESGQCWKKPPRNRTDRRAEPRMLRIDLDGLAGNTSRGARTNAGVPRSPAPHAGRRRSCNAQCFGPARLLARLAYASTDRGGHRRCDPRTDRCLLRTVLARRHLQRGLPPVLLESRGELRPHHNRGCSQARRGKGRPKPGERTSKATGEKSRS